MKFSIEQRVEQFKKYYARQNERPLFGFFLGSEYPLHRYPASKALPDKQLLKPSDFNPADYVNDCHELFRCHEEAGGDFIWAASAFWAIPWVEVALGCPIISDISTGSIHAEKPENFSPDTLPGFDPDSPWLKLMDDFLATFAQASSGTWPLATTRMRGIADLLAALYGNDVFIMKFFEAPDEIKAVCEKLTDFWIEMAKFQFDRIPDFHGGIGSFYYNMWAPSKTVWHQEDAVALLSPDIYREFIEPCDRRIVQELKNCIMHLHPTGYIPVDPLIDMKMTAIEMHVDEGGKTGRELNEYHVKILAERPLLIWGQLSDDDLDYIFSELPCKGLAVQTVVETPEKAHRLWEKYMTKYGV